MDRPPKPWEEYEERELLCNIIRTSPSIQLGNIYNFIAQQRVQPSWENIPLPQGRTLHECRIRFEAAPNVSPYTLQPPYGQPPFGGASGGYGGPSRMQPPYNPQQPIGRTLLPKTTPTTPSEGGPAFPQSPLAEQQPVRKRGRPPKEEVMRRRAEAELKGEVYPAPRSKRAKRLSQPQEASSPAMSTALSTPYQSHIPGPPITSTPTGAAPTETGSESSGSKRRRLERLQRPADIETTGMRSARDPISGSYESPPQTGFTGGQPSASTTSGADIDTRMEGAEDPAPSTRTQSYREIVGIRGSTSR